MKEKDTVGIPVQVGRGPRGPTHFWFMTRTGGFDCEPGCWPLSCVLRIACDLRSRTLMISLSSYEQTHQALDRVNRGTCRRAGSPGLVFQGDRSLRAGGEHVLRRIPRHWRRLPGRPCNISFRAKDFAHRCVAERAPLSRLVTKLITLAHVRRQLKLENRTFVDSPRHPNTTVMACDDRMADRKANSHTTLFGREHRVENM